MLPVARVRAPWWRRLAAWFRCDPDDRDARWVMMRLPTDDEIRSWRGEWGAVEEETERRRMIYQPWCDRMDELAIVIEVRNETPFAEASESGRQRPAPRSYPSAGTPEHR